MAKMPLLFTGAQRVQLLVNEARGRACEESGRNHDPMPVVKWFVPEGAATWLITELDPTDEDRAFGLCDLGLGEPELGYVSVAEIQSIRTPRLKLPIERDLYFTPK